MLVYRRVAPENRPSWKENSSSYHQFSKAFAVRFKLFFCWLPWLHRCMMDNMNNMYMTNEPPPTKLCDMIVGCVKVCSWTSLLQKIPRWFLIILTSLSLDIPTSFNGTCIFKCFSFQLPFFRSANKKNIFSKDFLTPAKQKHKVQSSTVSNKHNQLPNCWLWYTWVLCRQALPCWQARNLGSKQECCDANKTIK